MPGITFGRSSAKRIVDVVRKVERIPGGEQSLQRQRAGGLGRSTLWAVTAVQTGPGTVTIKRVSNISFALNGPSKKENVLYDPALEPSVGDRGLLIRLGEGDLFFFSKEAGPTVVYLTDYRFIKQSAPDTNFGADGRDCEIVLDGATPDEFRGIMKFERRITANDPIFDSVVLRRVRRVNATVEDGGGSAPVADITFKLDVYKITQNFTPSLITWNTYAVLSRTKVSSDDDSLIFVAARSDVAAEEPIGEGRCDEFYMGLWKGAASQQKWDLSGAYGLSFHIVIKSSVGVPIDYNADLIIRRGIFSPLTFPDSYVIAGLRSTFVSP